MYSNASQSPPAMTIALEDLSSACGQWRVQGHVTLSMAKPVSAWHALSLEETLDYGTLAGLIRFVLDASSTPVADIAALEPLLPTLFPHLSFTEQSLTITSGFVSETKGNKQSRLHSCRGDTLAKRIQEEGLTAAVLVWGQQDRMRGQWFLTPYHDVTRIDPVSQLLIMPYAGYLETQHFKPHYFEYPQDS